MSYSSEVIRIARNRLAERKDQRMQEYRRRLSEAYSRVPRIHQIDRELRLTMAKAAQAAFIQGEDGREVLNQAKEQNQALRRERELLVLQHLPDGWLEQRPACDKCGDTGYVGTEMCTCLAELCSQEQRKKIGRLSGGMCSFDQFCTQYYPERIDPALGMSARAVMEKTVSLCRSYAEEFCENAGNMLFSGDTGLGKTFLSGCIAGVVADRGYSVIYESAPTLFAKMEKAKFDADSDARRDSDNYADCDLLIIDDLGTEMAGQFVNSAFYALLNERLMLGKSMIISTNLTSDELSRRYSSPISSRLRGSFRRVPFIGDDIRVLKNRGMV